MLACVLNCWTSDDSGVIFLYINSCTGPFPIPAAFSSCMLLIKRSVLSEHLHSMCFDINTLLSLCTAFKVNNESSMLQGSMTLPFYYLWSVSQQDPIHVLSVPEPHTLMTKCDTAECCKCAHSWDLNKRDSVVEALDRANGSNNGSLFQTCCLSHRLPLTRQCHCCSAWLQLYPISYATGYVVLLTCSVCLALVS